MINIKKYKEYEDGTTFFEMSNEQVKVCLSNLGCHLLSIYTKDRQGQMGDIILGYASQDECLNDTAYVGAFVGRFANRIAKGKFSLNGQDYQLAVNSSVNHIHGGIEGFNHKLFDYEILEDGIRFHGISEDGEEGYPGKLTMDVTYRLKGNEFFIEYDADSDKDTILNLTTHTYFNLTGGKEKIYDHQLKMKAKTYAAIDETGLPTGEYPAVEGSPFDFTDFHAIGERIAEDHIQIKRGTGYDHPFQLEGEEDQAVLMDPTSGRKVIITTSLPFLQVYTGNYLSECISSKWGRKMEDRDGVAIEAEFLPDSINQEEDSKAILRKGDHYHQLTIYRFETE